MSSHPIAFLLLGNNFGTPEMRKIWSAQNRLTQQINVDVALASAEGELGVISQQAALSIAKLATSITEQDLDHGLDPAHYTGCPAQKVDDVIRFAVQSGHLTSPEEPGL